MKIAGLMLLALLVTSCTSDDQSCHYAEAPGLATVTDIQPAPSSLYNCYGDAVEVFFDFVPDSGEPSLQDTGRRVTVGAGANPPRAYIESKGFDLGAVLPAIREDILTGSCSPKEYRFPGVDLSDYAASCWAKP